MSDLPRIREMGKAIRAIVRGMRSERERMTQTTREAVTADAVRAPEREGMAEYVAKMDAAKRTLEGLRAERAALAECERLRLEASKMSEQRKQFLMRYYMRGESRLKLMQELGVSRWTVRRWIAAEEGRAEKG